jgi:hypothetical protein
VDAAQVDERREPHDAERDGDEGQSISAQRGTKSTIPRERDRDRGSDAQIEIQ